jgi:hypothetical protein
MSIYHREREGKNGIISTTGKKKRVKKIYIWDIFDTMNRRISTWKKKKKSKAIKIATEMGNLFYLQGNPKKKANFVFNFTFYFNKTKMHERCHLVVEPSCRIICFVMKLKRIVIFKSIKKE